MTEIEKQALGLFKDYTLFDLKALLILKTNEMSDLELEILETAIELHRRYNHIKLTEAKSKKKNEIKA